MKRTEIATLLKTEATGQTVLVKGWVRTFRSNRFIAMNDGSTINNIQAVVDFENTDENLLKRVTTGSCLAITGVLEESLGKGQSVEIKVTNIEVLGDANADEYPLQPKKHSMEFLREIAHLRPRTNTFASVLRVRHALSFAVHKYFNDKGYYYINTPIITGSDAEGAGEMFRVTTLPLKSIPKKSNVQLNEIDWEKFDSIGNEYAEVLWSFINKKVDEGLNSKKPTKIGFFSKSILQVFSDFTSFKKFILHKPHELDELKRRYYDEGTGEVSTLKESFEEVGNSIYEQFRSGRMRPNFSKRELITAVKSVCLKNGYRIINKSGDNFKRKYGPKYPILSLCFFSLFEIENIADVDFSKDFFGKETNLTVSGQLEAELAAMALGKVYTFGPTFRAENSNTTRHLAEFWMIEPEVAFNDLDDNMDLAQDFMQYVISYAKEHCVDDLAFLADRLEQEDKDKPQAERSAMGLVEKLDFVCKNDFKRVSYTEAIEILKNSKPNKKKKFKYLIEEWGADLQSEHERFLVEKHFECPVILFDYPADIKAFYMRQNDDGKTVRAMDILFPGIGEIVGGSQREERLDVLKQKMVDFNIPEEEMWWYLETRKFGTAPHAGFGLGFERLVLFVTGMSNIRDVIPFPRTPQNAEF
jgi:aspartyl/asparaginyl-tRNA synthetase